jgi:hypothetical protein
MRITFPGARQTLYLSLLPPAQLNLALLYYGPGLLTETLLLSFALLLGFGLGWGIAFFKNSGSGILGNPFTQEKHGDENKDDGGCDNLASEYICRHRAKKWMCKETI